MPARDGRGPDGKGPTGRKLGPCNNPTDTNKRPIGRPNPRGRGRGLGLRRRATN